MRRALALLGVLAVVALAGCASNPCEGSHAYQKASDRGPLKAVDGLSVPQPDPSMQIPEVASNGPSFVSRHKNAQGREVTSCLATPPPLPPSQNAGTKVSSLRQ